MKIFQSAELSRDPLEAMEAVTKQYVDAQIASSAIVGGVFFTNIAPTSTGIVGSKQYVAGTVPINKVILNGTADTSSVTVTMFCEGGTSFYSPTITIVTDPPQAGGDIIATLAEDPNDKRSYTATANLTGITVETLVTATSSTGASATTTILRAGAGPAFIALTIGTLPGSQTEVKAGDVLTVTGRVENSATYAELIAGGAAASLSVLTLGAENSFGTGYRTATGTFTVGSGSGALSVTARGRNALGTYGANFTSTNTVTLNQTFPTIGARTIVYPGSQLALKGSETATVTATVSNFDTIVYSGTNVSPSLTTTYELNKTVTRVSGTYVFGTNNYTITATKASNGAVATASSAVSIADVAPTAAITVVGSPARLKSSVAGVDYTVTITANQRLLSAPSLDASSGTWQGSWAGSGTTWTRVLRIVDTDPKGSQLFSGLSVTGLASLVGSTITSGAAYSIGGFDDRIITFTAFARYMPIGTSIVDITKTVVSYTGGATLTRQTNTASVFQGYTIVNSAGTYDPTGDHLFISDEEFANSNTSGTLQLTIRENV